MEIQIGLKQILSGVKETFSFEYPCHSPTTERWFLLQAISAAGGLDAAAGKKIFVLRRGDNGLSDVLEIQRDDLLQGASPIWNVPIFAGDVVNTTNLQLAALDGLGDATAASGWFKTKPELTLNYAATITLSKEATAQLTTSANPLIGAAVAVLADRRGLAVPLNITGDVRHPQVQVDILRALGMR